MKRSYGVLVVFWIVLEPLGSNLDRFGGPQLLKIIEKQKGNQVFQDFCFLSIYVRQDSFLCYFGSFWHVFGASGSPVEAHWGLLRPSWGAFGLPWGLLECLFWTVCGPYGASWSTLGRLGAPGAPLLDILDRFWTFLSTLGSPFGNTGLLWERFRCSFLCVERHL